MQDMNFALLEKYESYTVRVTLTGADDKVDPAWMVSMSEKYPFVEWGILASEKRSGSPRYPEFQWIRDTCYILSRSGCRFAIHLCGEISRNYQERMINNHLILWVGPTLTASQARIQLNGTILNPIMPYFLASRPHILVAPKAHEAFSDDYMRFQNLFGHAHCLFDPSAGKGLSPETTQGVRRLGKMPLGIAGGIGEHNIQEKILFAKSVGATWVDMESSLRDEQQNFDTAKAERILSLANEVCCG